MPCFRIPALHDIFSLSFICCWTGSSVAWSQGHCFLGTSSSLRMISCLLYYVLCFESFYFVIYQTGNTTFTLHTHVATACMTKYHNLCIYKIHKNIKTFQALWGSIWYQPAEHNCNHTCTLTRTLTHTLTHIFGMELSTEQEQSQSVRVWCRHTTHTDQAYYCF